MPIMIRTFSRRMVTPDMRIRFREPEGPSEVFRFGLGTLGDTLTNACSALEAHPEQSEADDDGQIFVRSYRIDHGS